MDLPLPMAPTIETNSPRSTASDTSRSTWRAPFGVANDFETPANLDECQRYDRPQLRFGQTHQPVEHEADDADREDREQDVRVDQAVVFLPEEPADARRARQHLAGDDDQPGDAEAEPIAGEHVRQRRRHDDLREGRELRQPEHLGDVPVVLRDRAHAHHRVDDRRPHRADGDGEERGRLGLLESTRPSGSQASGEIGRRTCMSGSNMRVSVGDTPSRNPSGVAMAMPSRKPCATRTRL